MRSLKDFRTTALNSATRGLSSVMMAICLLMMLKVMGLMWEIDTVFSEDMMVVAHLRVSRAGLR